MGAALRAPKRAIISQGTGRGEGGMVNVCKLSNPMGTVPPPPPMEVLRAVFH